MYQDRLASFKVSMIQEFEDVHGIISVASLIPEQPVPEGVPCRPPLRPAPCNADQRPQTLQPATVKLPPNLSSSSNPSPQPSATPHLLEGPQSPPHQALIISLPSFPLHNAQSRHHIPQPLPPLPCFGLARQPVHHDCHHLAVEDADSLWCSLNRASPDAQLAALTADLSIEDPAEAGQEEFVADAFTPDNLKRAMEACGLDFHKRRLMPFQRWPMKVIAAALDKLQEEFKKEVWGQREVLLAMLKKLIKNNNKLLSAEAEASR
jgi:hypothetical protein